MRPASPREVNGYVTESTRIVEAFRGEHNKQNQSLVLATNHFDTTIDVSWLPIAAQTYNISADPKDYVLTEVPGVTVDIPNRNSQAFPYEEISYFDPIIKRVGFNTFAGAMTAFNHDNKDPLKARGIIFDVALREIPKYGIAKIVTLCGWDRTKDKWLAEGIASGKRNKYSMGALVCAFICSYCGNIDTDAKQCECMTRYGKGAIRNGRLIYQLCTGVNYIEMSSVDDPADVTAEGVRV